MTREPQVKRGGASAARRVAYRVVLLGLLTALALALSFAENVLPLPAFLPGAKLGLANLVTLLALYLFPEWHDAALVLCLRVALGSVFTGGGAFWYSAVGAALSFALMCFLRRLGLSLVAVSAAGGIAHNVGQLAAAMLVLRTAALFAYAPILAALGLASGLAIGLLAATLLPVLRRHGRFEL
ncbi:MAG: Gx transporter family protein [Schwartzia sp. (in: firmicutes)]